MEKVRLQKYIAQAGIASRRKAEEFIKAGKVSINDNIVIEPWFMVGKNDSVRIDGELISPEEELIYIMLNKPEGYISTVKEQFSRKAVLDLVKDVKQRIYPVGRLDYDTEGLLLLTNDGELTYKLTHPKYEVSKTYIAQVKGILNSEEISKFQSGLVIEDYITSPAKLKVIGKCKDISTLKISIHEGRNRQVRKMCEAIGHPVVKLKRTSIGSLNIDQLALSKWRYLTEQEIQELKK